MKISEIKKNVGVETLMLVRQLTNDELKAPTEWVSHWDNDRRIRITMHEDVMAMLKADPEFAGLALKKEEVLATDERAAYTRFVVITPKHVEATF